MIAFSNKHKGMVFLLNRKHGSLTLILLENPFAVQSKNPETQMNRSPSSAFQLLRQYHFAGKRELRIRQTWVWQVGEWDQLTASLGYAARSEILSTPTFGWMDGWIEVSWVSWCDMQGTFVQLWMYSYTSEMKVRTHSNKLHNTPNLGFFPGMTSPFCVEEWESTGSTVSAGPSTQQALSNSQLLFFLLLPLFLQPQYGGECTPMFTQTPS